MTGKTFITGTGSYIPTVIKTNKEFASQSFFSEEMKRMQYDADVIIEKFEKITGIAQRRYVTDDLNTSDIAGIAAKKAVEDIIDSIKP